MINQGQTVNIPKSACITGINSSNNTNINDNNDNKEEFEKQQHQQHQQQQEYNNKNTTIMKKNGDGDLSDETKSEDALITMNSNNNSVATKVSDKC